MRISGVALVNKMFRTITAFEGIFFVAAFFFFTAAQRGQNPDGGREMGLVFPILLPILILGAMSLLFWKTNSPAPAGKTTAS